MTVRFRKGPRSWDEEEIDVLGIEEIRSALLSVLESDSDDAKEQLKPHNMALASPRVFWGLVRHFGGDEHRPVDPMQSLHDLLPNADLSFMYTRARQMSDKALDNMRQMEALAAKRAAARARRQERAALRAAKQVSSNSNSGGEMEELEEMEEMEEAPPNTIEDLCGKEASDVLKTLGVQTLDDLAKQEAPALVLRDQTLDRDVVGRFIEDARQEVIVRRLGMIVTEVELPPALDVTLSLEDLQARAVSSSSSSSSSQEDETTALHVILLQDSGFVAPRDLTLVRTPAIFEKITSVAKEMNIQVPTEDVISRWRMRAWAHIANQTWLTDYYCAPEE